MASSDPVGDMIAMIKNAYGRRHARVQLPHSRMKEGVAQVLKSEGYLVDVRTTVADEKIPAHKTLHLYLKYDLDGVSVITADVMHKALAGEGRPEWVSKLPPFAKQIARRNERTD